MRFTGFLALLFLLSGRALAALPGLPEEATYDAAIPAPAAVLGWEVGEWHVRHDQLVDYLSALAEASPRVALLEQGRTHEARRQILLVISSPENLARLDEIEARHRAIARGERADDGRERPAIAALLYSIHGNEASGSNAAMVVAYHLAASRDAEVAELLDDVVVLLDPSQNPDGLGRFALWANMHKSRTPNDDPRHREHDEGWPNGRTNHYWFDLNRDWLPLVHPESRNRIATFHRFRPTVLGDFHEMGSDGSYFFQPGVPSRQNPLTDARNLDLSRRIARFHAEQLDAAGEFYYSEEGFDDYYYGKGSTYPDAHGSIGILFEQASARGHLRKTARGPLAFADAIANHVRTSLSTLRATQEMRAELLAYQAAAPAEALALAQSDPVGAWVCDAGADRGARRELLELLRAHQIEVRALRRDIEVEGRSYAAASGFAVPLAQPQARLVKALLQPVDRFPDTEFYDVSTWALPLAFDIACDALPRARFGSLPLGEPLREADPPSAASVEPALAWAMEWSSSDAPRVLSRLLRAGVKARVATRPFSNATGPGTASLERGTIVIPSGGRGEPVENLPQVVRDALAGAEVDITPLATGLTPDGVDLGSPSVPVIEPPKALLVVGSGVSTYEAGEMWHLLDQRLEVPVSLVERAELGDVAWHEYTHVILVDGQYGAIGDATVGSLRNWVRAGGVVIASQRGAEWVQDTLCPPSEPDADNACGVAESERPDAEKQGAPKGNAEKQAAEGEEAEEKAAPQAAYGGYEADRAKALVAGAIFAARLDRTHPLGFGLADDVLPVFRDHTRKIEASRNPYENVGVYTTQPRLSGYAAEETARAIAGDAALVVRTLGQGTLVLFADNPTFRGFFRGTQRLVANALFFGAAVQGTTAPDTWLRELTPTDEDEY